MGIEVSVIIPCYNHGAFLPEAVESVASARRDDVEMIVVDDGSTDELTQRTVRDLKQPGLKVIQQQNKGLATARNVAIENARGKYILPLDADNRIRAEYISFGKSILDANPRAGVVYGDANYFGTRSGLWHIGAFDADRLLRRNYIDACAMIRREVWADNGGYDKTMPMQGHEDWDFWLGALKRGWGFVYVPKILFDYRVAAESMITRTHGRDRENMEFILRKHADLFSQVWLDIGEERRCIGSTLRHAASIFRKKVRRRLRIGERDGRFWFGERSPGGKDSAKQPDSAAALPLSSKARHHC